MNRKVQSIAVYCLSVVVLTLISIEIGSEIITQYSMYTNGYAGVDRHHLADDMGFGMLLMFGLILEVIVGVGSGCFIGKKINAKFKKT